MRVAVLNLYEGRYSGGPGGIQVPFHIGPVLRRVLFQSDKLDGPVFPDILWEVFSKPEDCVWIGAVDVEDEERPLVGDLEPQRPLNGHHFLACAADYAHAKQEHDADVFSVTHPYLPCRL